MEPAPATSTVMAMASVISSVFDGSVAADAAACMPIGAVCGRSCCASIGMRSVVALAVAQHLDANGRADRAVGDEPHELRRVGNRLAVERHDDVTRLQARLEGTPTPAPSG